MSASAFAAVGIGAALGAWMRWGLASVLNPALPTLPLGTLASNLIGGYLIGLAVAFFADNASVPAEVRMFVITGFLGGLTTFSTFSAEAVALLARAQYGWGAALILSHLAGSMVMTILGMATFNWLKN
jgi:fluoride exporter